MSSKKAKWKNSVEKARRESLGSSRKSSVIGEETTANELEEYLETLKKKSGIKSLWTGGSFDRIVRDEEDKTPDISISSVEDEEFGKMSELVSYSVRILRFHSYHLVLSTYDLFFSFCVCSTVFSFSILGDKITTTTRSYIKVLLTLFLTLTRVSAKHNKFSIEGRICKAALLPRNQPR